MKPLRKPVWNVTLRLRAKHQARRRLLEVIGAFHRQTNATMERAQAANEQLLASLRHRPRCSDVGNGPCDYETLPYVGAACLRCGNTPPRH